MNRFVQDDGTNSVGTGPRYSRPTSTTVPGNDVPLHLSCYHLEPTGTSYSSRNHPHLVDDSSYRHSTR